MDEKFNALAQYNAEKYRGLVHTPEWAAKMERLQAAFHESLHSPSCSLSDACPSGHQ